MTKDKLIYRMLACVIALAMILSAAKPLVSYAADIPDGNESADSLSLAGVASDAVEAAPAEETAPAEEATPTEEAPVEGVTPEDESTAETAAPAEEVTPTEEVAPTEETTPIEEAAPTEEVTTTEGADQIEQEDEADKLAMPAFSESATVDGVVVSVQADDGVFPEGATLAVAKVPAKEQTQAAEAVDGEREDGQNVAVSYTFDIKVLDADGNELQPADGKVVHVSFSTAEVADRNLKTQVYHIHEEDNGKLAAESLEAKEKGKTVTAETDGFSLYTVEFTYGNLQYVMEGDTSVALADILKEIGLTGEATAVEVSRPDLFSATNESGEWVVTAHQAFASTEWMQVTINNVVYSIVVTDAQQGFYRIGDFGDDAQNDRCYLASRTDHNNGRGFGINVHSYVDPNGKVSYAYCLEHSKQSKTANQSSPDTDFTYSASMPSTYSPATYPIILGYGNNSIMDMNRMLGVNMTSTFEGCQATQAAVWARLNGDSFGWPINIHLTEQHSSSDALKTAEKLVELSQTIENTSGEKFSLSTDQAKISEDATQVVYEVSIAIKNCFGGFDGTISGLPSGSRVERSRGSVVPNGNTFTCVASDGTAKLKITIPKTATAQTVTISAHSIIKPNNPSYVFGDSKSSSYQDLLAVTEKGSPLTGSEILIVPALPAPADKFNITVQKRDLNTGNAVTSGVEYMLQTKTASGWAELKRTGIDSNGHVSWTDLSLSCSRSALMTLTCSSCLTRNCLI